MKILHAAALIAYLAGPFLASPLLVSPAAAQHLNLMPELKSKTPEEKEQDAIADKAYRESLRKIPDTKSGVDPWGNVRSEAPKPAPAKRTKTGSSAN
jgi:hypothetical protein